MAIFGAISALWFTIGIAHCLYFMIKEEVAYRRRLRTQRKVRDVQDSG
jgi:hypothetical protein